MAKSKSRRSVKDRLGNVLAVAGIVVGLCLVGMPALVETVDAFRRARVVEALELADVPANRERSEALLAQAEAYNARLAGEGDPDQEIAPYSQQLSLDGHDTAFGYVKCPTIGLVMPIYRGTSDAALSAGAGHMEGTSLPVGGASTHTVVTGHSGLQGMRAFDDLRRLGEGDVFGFKVLGRLVCYRVTSTEVVTPDDLSGLAIEAGADKATLLTCTPYGVNSHRLLVHGTRCEVPEGFDRPVTVGDSMASDPRVWLFLLVLLVVVVIAGGRAIARRRKRGPRPGGGGEPPLKT